VTLLDALAMPIGFALGTGRFRKIIDKNHRVPLVKSFRVPPPAKPGAPFVEIDIFQGDSEFIVDNEYLGTVRLPATATGRRIDFRLDEEQLLHVFVEGAGDPKEVKLATRDTPEVLKKALAEQLAKRASSDDRLAAEKGGLFSSIKRLLGGR
jgi:molecular chaperone DnaK